MTEYRLIYFMIVLAYSLILINPLVTGIDTTTLAVALTLAIMITTLVRGIKVQILRKTWIVIAYLVVMVFIMLLNMLRQGGTTDPVEYVMLLILWPAFWLICIARFGAKLAFDIIPPVLALSIIIAVIAYVQYFISPSLWGYLQYRSNSLDWSENKSFEEFSLFFRASSLVGSPQVLGVIMPLAAVLLSMQNKIPLIIKIFFGSLILGAGLTSGSKVAVVLVFLFILQRSFFYITSSRIPRGVIFSLPLLLFLSIIILSNLNIASEWIPTVERIIDLQEAITQEKRDSRIDRLIVSFIQTNPFFGNGYSHSLFSEITGFRAAESYLAKLYFSFGILPFFLFIVLITTAMYRSSGPQEQLIKGILLMIFASMFISTAFESTAFFPFWALLIAGISGKAGMQSEHRRSTD